jgi:hypothetical protein
MSKRERLMNQRIENWLSEMRRDPNFMRDGHGRTLLDYVVDITFDGIDARTAESMILAAAGGDAAQLLEIFERQMRSVVEHLAETHDVDVVAEYHAEQAEMERDRMIDRQIDEMREAQ